LFLVRVTLRSVRAATGHVRGAAIGAAAGALIGAAVEEDQAARYHPPPGGFPFAQLSGRPGLFYSPYTGRLCDLRGVPRGGLARDVDTGELFRKPQSSDSLFNEGAAL
jgi:hypothetical protein